MVQEAEMGDCGMSELKPEFLCSNLNAVGRFKTGVTCKKVFKNLITEGILYEEWANNSGG